MNKELDERDALQRIVWMIAMYRGLSGMKQSAQSGRCGFVEAVTTEMDGQYQFILENIFCFDIQSTSSLTKYLKYNLKDFGSVVVRCKNFLIPLSLNKSTVNYDFLKELFHPIAENKAL